MNRIPIYKVKSSFEYNFLLKLLKSFNYNINDFDGDFLNKNIVVLNLGDNFGVVSNLSNEESDNYGRYLCENILIFLDTAAKLKNKNFDFNFLDLYKIICRNKNEANSIIELLRKKSIEYEDYGIENGKYYIVVLNNLKNISLNYDTIYEYYHKIFGINLDINNLNIDKNTENLNKNTENLEDYLLLLI